MTCALCDRTDSDEIYNDGHHILHLRPSHADMVFWRIMGLNVGRVLK